MKKVALLLLMFITLQASAQKFHIIPKVGFNISSTTHTQDANYRTGINIGVSGEYMLTQRFAIEPGVYYSVQGYGGDVSDRLSLGYINIPIYAKGYLYKGLYVFGGPQVGFNTYANWSTLNMKEYINTLDLAIGLGVGYQMSWGMLISANYNIGLTKPYGKDLRDLFETENSRNSVIQVNIGWRF